MRAVLHRYRPLLASLLLALFILGQGAVSIHDAAADHGAEADCEICFSFDGSQLVAHATPILHHATYAEFRATYTAQIAPRKWIRRAAPARAPPLS